MSTAHGESDTEVRTDKLIGGIVHEVVTRIGYARGHLTVAQWVEGPSGRGESHQQIVNISDEALNVMLHVREQANSRSGRA